MRNEGPANDPKTGLDPTLETGADRRPGPERQPSDLVPLRLADLIPDSNRSRQELLHLASQQGMTPRSYLARTWPAIAGRFPRISDEEILTGASVPLYRLANTRLEICGGCPHGGRCSGHSQEGKVPVWRMGALAFDPCPKWQDYLFAQKLMRAGLPEHLIGHTLEGLFGDEKSAVHEWLEGLSSLDVRSDKYRWLVLSGRDLSRLSKIAGVVLASASVLTNGIVVYKNLRLLEQQLQEYFQTKDDYPLERVRQAGVVVIDHYDLSRVRPWCAQHMETFLVERSLRPTVIVTPQAPSDLRNEQPMLADLIDSATVYQS
jgi:hypothetical protein